MTPRALIPGTGAANRAGSKTPLHSHPDAMLVSLRNSKARFTLPDKTTQDSVIGNETAVYTPATTHVSANVVTTPVDALLVEFKAKQPGTATLPSSREGLQLNVLAEAPRAIAIKTTAAPDFHEPAGTTHDYDQVVISLGANDMSLAIDGKPVVQLAAWNRAVHRPRGKARVEEHERPPDRVRDRRDPLTLPKGGAARPPSASGTPLRNEESAMTHQTIRALSTASAVAVVLMAWTPRPQRRVRRRRGVDQGRRCLEAERTPPQPTRHPEALKDRKPLRCKVGRAVAIALATSSVGCAVSMRAPQVDSRAEVSVAVNANQARLRMRSLVGPMCGEIERTADQIAAGTSDPAVRRAALRWKIDAVPALSAALFQPEPMTAVLDSWVFFNQMADFFETGAGKDELSDSAPVAVEASRRLEQQIADVFAAMTVSGDVSRVRAFAKSWAAAHPIRYAIRDRETALGRALERDVPESWSTGEAVADITTSVDDLNRKLDVYYEHVFRQARWEAELAASDLRLADVPPLAERSVQSAESLAAAFDRIAPSFERLAAVAETTPGFVASERKATIDEVAGELTRMITFLERERIVALKQVTEERVAAIDTIGQALSQERKALERDMERVGVQLVDHAVWRLAQLLAAVLVCLGVGTLGILLLVRKLFVRPDSRA